MRPSPLVGIAVAVLVLAGCVNQAPEPTEAPTPSATASETPSATPTPEPSAAPTPVDPAAYATQVEHLFGPGVDFNSVDGNVQCGIWESREASSPEGLVAGPYAGCLPLYADYQTSPDSAQDGNVGCGGGQLVGDRPVEPVCNNGAAFVGQSAAILPVGSSIAYAGFTCTSVDEATIDCARDSDGGGFTVSRTAYAYFLDAASRPTP
jgi:hypothetical protein